MEEELLAQGQEEALSSLSGLLQQRSVELVLELSVHQGNWIHVRAWLARARRFHAKVALRFVSGGDAKSLGELDGDALASVHGIFRQWFREHPLHPDASEASQSAEVALSRVRRWQREGADRLPAQGDLALPDVEHSLVSDEATFEAFLAELLRIYRAPYVERLLERVASAPSFVEQARERRSLRLVALWRACVFQYSESLVHLRQILNDPEEATHRLGHDRDALVGTPWETWVNGWLEQLRLVSLGRRDQQFDIARPGPATVPAHARVTVLIPAYNHEAFVGDAVRSVLGQSRTDFQILVVDDASTDRTFEEAVAFDDPRVRVIRNQSNLGLGQSVARALEDVGSEFVAILNSDDLFHPERLERCLGRLEEEPQWQLVATALVPIDKDRRVCRVADSSPVFDGEAIHNWLRWFEESAAVSAEPADLFGALLERNFLITSSNLVARTSFLRRHREWWQHLEFCLDWQILLIAAREDALCCVPDGLLGYRLHARNTVWFDSHRRWRYYLESHQVAARALEDLMDGGTRAGAEVFSTVLTAISDHLVRNTNIDLPGVVLGRSLERLHLRPLQLEAQEVADRLEALDTARHRRLSNEYHFRELGAKPEDLYRMRGEAPYLHSVRNRYEALQGDHEHLRAETHELQERLNRWSAERDRALNSFERRLGDLLANRLRLRAPLLAAKRVFRALQRVGARAPRMLTQSGSRAGRRQPVAIVAATGRFPIYSHTFVYQELMGLGEMGLNVKLFYWFQESSEKLHDAYAELARNSVKLVSIRDEHLRDMEYWKRTLPGRLEALLARIADRSRPFG